ncbi:hypothetical protein GUITHDRAFT_135751 [Guillardia theta CCMP2712]|uniref:Bulb-type lectin domain-containing protein n=1 Tax=Guillardia theta (strain CCMP2712) TaxID=905079 RepID=L1JLU4_GUITC|nr:hypothetical protein GUITHDRAFT_135751 [Guillardia theta CCMP2712]EKX49536.1 hypothetical protein GUITHDRAFT_135751 [Guillardia theta CCMP2712]|eukprot:XP_005836516.1 hypothetical protein GUITHDRAFT_135751 [Guillardia theta CCMP2712]
MTRSMRAAAAAMAGVLLMVLATQWEGWQAEDEEKLVRADVPEASRKVKLSQSHFHFEPADPRAMEKEERRAELDKIHKGFLPDPYKLGVHVEISTKSTVTSTSTLADELRDVTSAEDGSLEQQLKVNGMPIHVDLRGDVKETRGGDAADDSEGEISAVIWITGKTETTFSRASADTFQRSLAEVLHINPEDIKLSLSDITKRASDATASSDSRTEPTKGTVQGGKESSGTGEGGKESSGTGKGGEDDDESSQSGNSTCDGCEGWSMDETMEMFEDAQRRIKRLKSVMNLRPELNKVRLLTISKLSKRVKENAVFELEFLKQSVRLLETRYEDAVANVTGMIHPLMPNAMRLRDELVHARFATDMQIIALDKTMNATTSALGRFLWLKRVLEEHLQLIEDAKLRWQNWYVKLQVDANSSLDFNVSKEREVEADREVSDFEELFSLFYNAESQSLENLQGFERRTREHLASIERVMADVLYDINISSIKELQELHDARQDETGLTSRLYDVSLGEVPLLVEQLQLLNVSIDKFRQDFMADAVDASRSFQKRWGDTLAACKQALLDRINAKDDSFLARQKRLLDEVNESSWNSVQLEFSGAADRLQEEEMSMAEIANVSARQWKENEEVLEQLEQTLQAMEASLQDEMQSEDEGVRNLRRYGKESIESVRGELRDQLGNFAGQEADEMKTLKASLKRDLEMLVEHGMQGNLSRLVQVWKEKGRKMGEGMNEMLEGERSRLRNFHESLRELRDSFNHSWSKLSRGLRDLKNISASKTSYLYQLLKSQDEQTNSSLRSFAAFSLLGRKLEQQLLGNFSDLILRKSRQMISSWTREEQQELLESLTDLSNRVESQRLLGIEKLMDFQSRLEQAKSDSWSTFKLWNISAEGLRGAVENTTLRDVIAQLHVKNFSAEDWMRMDGLFFNFSQNLLATINDDKLRISQHGESTLKSLLDSIRSSLNSDSSAFHAWRSQQENRSDDFDSRYVRYRQALSVAPPIPIAAHLLLLTGPTALITEVDLGQEDELSSANGRYRLNITHGKLWLFDDYGKMKIEKILPSSSSSSSSCYEKQRWERNAMAGPACREQLVLIDKLGGMVTATPARSGTRAPYRLVLSDEGELMVLDGEDREVWSNEEHGRQEGAEESREEEKKNDQEKKEEAEKDKEDKDKDKVKKEGKEQEEQAKELEMPADVGLLNSFCASWRDSQGQQSDELAVMAKCMQQDCVQSLKQVGCRWRDTKGLCYVDSGQQWCQLHPNSPGCLGGTVMHALCLSLYPRSSNELEQSWGPVQHRRRSDDQQRLSCSCMRRCSYQSSNKKFRCAQDFTKV